MVDSVVRHSKNKEMQCSDSSVESSNRAGMAPVKEESSTLGPTPSETIQDEIVPLTGNPFFTCVLAKSQAESPFQLTIPKSFQRCLPARLLPVVLCCHNKCWKMSYYGDRTLKRFDGGWRKFALDNKLKIGDGCVFELMDSKKLQFKVQILTGEMPPEFAESQEGHTSETPIVID